MTEDLFGEELEFYRANNRFVDEYKGRYLVIKGSELIGDFGDREDAVREVYRCGFARALVRKAGERTIPLLATDVPGRVAPLLTPLDPDTLEPLAGEALERYYEDRKPTVVSVHKSAAPSRGTRDVEDGVHLLEEDECSCCAEHRVAVRIESPFSLFNLTPTICIKCLDKAYRKALAFKSKLEAAP